MEKATCVKPPVSGGEHKLQNHSNNNSDENSNAYVTMAMLSDAIGGYLLTESDPTLSALTQRNTLYPTTVKLPSVNTMIILLVV